MIIIIIININYQKSFKKQPAVKQVLTFLSFFFSLTTVYMFFPFPYQSICKFEKLMTFHRQVFIVYKNGENFLIY